MDEDAERWFLKFDALYRRWRSLETRYQKLWCDFRKYMIEEYVFVNAEGKANKKQIEDADSSFSATASMTRADSFSKSAQPSRHDWGFRPKFYVDCFDRLGFVEARHRHGF
jgi:hypothetical protein